MSAWMDTNGPTSKKIAMPMAMDDEDNMDKIIIDTHN
jgi:hypothetical protein